MPRGRKRKREKKTAKNVYLKKSQVNYIQKHCGGKGKFSPFLSKVIDLYITLSKNRIITELTDESIARLKQEILEEYARKNFKKDKIMEYKSIFEQIAKELKFFIPNVRSALEFYIPLLEHYHIFDYDKMKPSELELLKKIAKYSNMLDEIEFDHPRKIITLKGMNPYTLHWYAKMLLLALSHTKNHWQIKEIQKNESQTIIRIFVEKGESVESAIDIISRKFAGFNVILSDMDDNSGIWNYMNEPFNVILDKQYINATLSSEETNRDLIPFKSLINSLDVNDKFGSITAIFTFYAKIRLISKLSINKVKKTITFIPELGEFIIEMLEKSLNYLQTGEKLKKTRMGSLFTFTFS